MKIIRSGNINIKSKLNKSILLDYRYSKSDKKQPLLLYIHGFKGFKDWGYFNLMADYYAQQGFVFVKMNFSHNGTTPDYPTEFADLEAFGHNNFTKELDDIESVLDYLCTDTFEIYQQIDFDKLFIKGHSRGGGVSILKAYEDDRIKGIATYAGINNLKYSQSEEILMQWKSKGVTYIFNSRTHQDMPMYYQIVEDVLANEKRFDIAYAVKQMDKRMLIIHGTNDETLPVNMANTMQTWNPDATLKIIEEANHTFGGAHPYTDDKLPKHALTAINLVIDFFQ